MNVLIALASSSGHLSGVQRHALNLARCLLTRSEITAVHLVAAPWQQQFVRDSALDRDRRLHLHSAPIGHNTVSRNLWFDRRLPALAAQLQTDLVHLAYPVPVRRAAFHCPVVVTLHDLYPWDIPENFGFPRVFFNRFILSRCLSRADAVACVSKSTLDRLLAIHPHLAGRARVICNSVEPPPPGEYLPSPDWGTRPFLLCIAQHRRNKNILLALRVFERLLRSRQISPLTRLFLIGIPGPETPAIRAFIAASGLTQRVLLLSGISEAHLQWCYRAAGLLLAPSSIEGFGLPVAEALLAGCRVVCSDIPAFRELAGGQARCVALGPSQVEDFARAVSAELASPRPRPAALPQLSAPVIAQQYFDLYRTLLSAGGPARSAQTSPVHAPAESQFPL